MKILHENYTIELPEGSSGLDLAKELKLNAPEQALALFLNGNIVDLSHPLKDGDEVKFFNFDDSEGKEVFWHTSAHVLAQAILRLYPDAKLTIGPPIAAGFYYDFANLTISDDDLKIIEKEMQKIAKENHKPIRHVFKSKEEAMSAFKSNKYKCELISELPDNENITLYEQGEFSDLCRGPHLSSLGKIKAVKVLKTSGAYWRGDSKNEMLTRVYAISFPDKKQLQDHLKMLEEAKKRDHKIIGPKLDIFSLREEAPGMPFIHPRGMIIWNKLLELLRERLLQDDYLEIKTPSMMTRQLWEISGHWENYRENMFTCEFDERDYAIKPMNCPGCMLYYKTHIHSYRELPLRIGEIGNVHRYELSGALSGLLRCRSFHQDDAHIFMKPSDIEAEILGTLKFADDIYSVFGLEYHLELSTRPDKHTIGTDKEWEVATNGLQDALDKWGKPYIVNEGDGAFYGPKIDFHVKDAIGRTWQVGTIQLDMALPERFDLEYTEVDGNRHRPIMIHRAIFGSIERFFGILIENFSGRFPLWLSPLQMRLLPVADRHVDYCKGIKLKLQKAGFVVDVDASHESIGKKVRNAQLIQANYILTVGDRELENQTLSLRTRNNVVLGEISLESFLETVVKERDERSIQTLFKES